MTRRCPAWLAAAALLGACVAATASPLTINVVDEAGKPVADAIVAVLVKNAHSSAPAGTSGQIAQKDRQFQPQITVIQTGTSVLFPNFDTVRHHVYSFSPIQKFELKLYAGTPSAPIVFDKPGVAALGCNIHDRMSAWVLVVDTPLFAKTDAAGHATLEVPAGEHSMQAWHARLADPTTFNVQPLRMAAGATTVNLSLALTAAQ